MMKEQNVRRRIAAVLALLMAGALLLAGCGQNQQGETTPSEAVQEDTTAPTEAVQEETSASETVPEETLPVIEDPVGIPVETPYKTIHYPQEWENVVEAVQTDDGSNYTITFQTQVGGKDVVLFSVVLGPTAQEGYLLGQLQDETAGAVNVLSAMNEINPEEWTEEEFNQISALQERVNDIIIQFHEDERFVPNR